MAHPVSGAYPSPHHPSKVETVSARLAAAVALGGRLPGEEDRDGPTRVREEPDEPLRLTEQEPGALVRREPARETDGERLGAQELLGGPKRRGSRPLREEPGRKALAG